MPSSEHEGETNIVGRTIKYLHPSVRFGAMASGVQEFPAGPPPIKPVKPLSNLDITRVFVGFIGSHGVAVVLVLLMWLVVSSFPHLTNHLATNLTDDYHAMSSGLEIKSFGI